MNVKVVFFFRLNVQGWTETFYINKPDLDQGLARALIYASKRHLLLADPAVIDAIRVGDAANIRSSRLVGVGAGTSFPMPLGGYTSKADQPDTAAQCSLFDTPNAVQRTMMLRGLPDNVYDVGNPGNPDQMLWQTRLNDYLQTFYVPPSGDALIAERIRLGGGGTERVITNVTPDWTANETDLTLETPLTGVANGHLLNIYGMRGFAPTPGTVMLKRTANLGANAIVHWVPNKPTLYSGGATLVVAEEVWQPVTFASFIRIANRKTGRPFGVPRGRRRALAR